MSKPKVALVGCNFVGQSIGLAIKRALSDVDVVGHDKDREAMRAAEAAKAVDRTDWNLPGACENAAAIFICTPHADLDVTLKAIAPDLGPNSIVASVGSLNVAALKLAQDALAKDVPFFSTALVFHPDRVTSAMAQPDADALREAIWTIVPTAETSSDKVDTFLALVGELGAKPLFVDPVERDGMAIAVEVMPAVLGSMLMRAVSNDGAWREREWMAGAAFGRAVESVGEAQQFVSALIAQPDSSIHWLNQIMLECMALRDAIRARDVQSIERILEQAEERRQQWLTDWRKGRDEGRVPIERPAGLLAALVGERMASRITGNKKR